MTPDLTKLTRLMPVPDFVRDQMVNWGKLEKAVGLQYPASFKEFVGAYGTLRWFVRWCPVCCTAKSRSEIKGYLDLCAVILDRFDSARFDDDWQPLATHPKKYPETGGLFPFMASCDGDEYSWVTKGDPDT
jgi:hypothetical protein